MRKVILLSTGILIALFSILFFQAKSVTLEINKTLNTLQQKQLNVEEIISKLDLKINKKIAVLSKDAEEQSSILGLAVIEAKTSSLVEIEKVKSLIMTYTEKVKTKNAAERLLIVNALVESDGPLQQFLSEGFIEYKKEDFTAAVKIYKKILYIDPSNTEALCYFNASLYYQNPADGSSLPGIKNDLIPLLEEKVLTKDEELTALNVLAGISREEGY